MDKLFVATNQYYAALERFGLQYFLKSPWPWAWVVVVIGFCWQGIFFITNGKKLGITMFFDLHFYALLFIEICIIYISHKIQADKTKVVLARINSKYNKSFQTVDQARRYLLIQYFGREENEYLAFSDEITKAISYQEQLRSPLSFGLSHFFLFLYNPDSKQRVYALLIVIVTALTALSIRDGGSINDIFSFFSADSFIDIIVVWFLLVIFLAGFLVLLLFARMGIEVTCSYLIIRLEGITARNPYTLKYLQRDLLKFHRFIQLQYK